MVSPCGQRRRGISFAAREAAHAYRGRLGRLRDPRLWGCTACGARIRYVLEAEASRPIPPWWLIASPRRYSLNCHRVGPLPIDRERF